jgi:large subunit ribosomal protein L30
MEEKNNSENKGNLAVIRIKGGIGLVREVKDTLSMLRLHGRNFCVVVPNTDNYTGMIKIIKDYVSWGEIDDNTLKELIEKRGEEYKDREMSKNKKIKYNKFTIHGNKKIKKFFRLNSPKKGYGRKGVKEVFSKGGALGYRGEKINDLIVRMI